MTFLLAALDNAYRQAARAGGVWADALLTAWSPLTYERGDYCDASEKVDPDYEPSRCWDDGCVRVGEHDGWHMDGGTRIWCTPKDFPQDPEVAAPPAASAPPGGGEAPSDPAPPPGPHVQLPMFKASDLEMVALEYINKHRIIAGCSCECGGWKDSGPGLARVLHNHAEHVAELVVSALVFELQGMAWDQSHPEAQK